MLARVEVLAAIWRKQRNRQLSEEHARLLTAAFEADWHDADSACLPLVVNELVLETAGAARSTGADLTAFLCFDVDLAATAAREGWAPPE